METIEGTHLVGIDNSSECSICLNDFTKKSKVLPCLHEFCFDCILKWSKIRNVCPLCNCKFSTLMHDITADDQYELHDVPEVDQVQALWYESADIDQTVNLLLHPALDDYRILTNDPSLPEIIELLTGISTMHNSTASSSIIDSSFDTSTYGSVDTSISNSYEARISNSAAINITNFIDTSGNDTVGTSPNNSGDASLILLDTNSCSYVINLHFSGNDGMSDSVDNNGNNLEDSADTRLMFDSADDSRNNSADCSITKPAEISISNGFDTSLSDYVDSTTLFSNNSAGASECDFIEINGSNCFETSINNEFDTSLSDYVNNPVSVTNDTIAYTDTSDFIEINASDCFETSTNNSCDISTSNYADSTNSDRADTTDFSD